MSFIFSKFVNLQLTNYFAFHELTGGWLCATHGVVCVQFDLLASERKDEYDLQLLVPLQVSRPNSLCPQLYSAFLSRKQWATVRRDHWISVNQIFCYCQKLNTCSCWLDFWLVRPATADLHTLKSIRFKSEVLKRPIYTMTSVTVEIWIGHWLIRFTLYNIYKYFLSVVKYLENHVIISNNK